MELYQLRGFLAVAELGHVTRAAERLHLSQPALSAQIKALEDDLGVTLFERGTSGMTLTAAGKSLLPDAANLVAAAAALHGKARAMEGEITGHVRLGTLSDPEFIRLGEFLSLATERYPLVEIEMHHEVSGAAFEKVRDGALDTSFYYGERTHPAVAALLLRRFAYCIASPAAWHDKVEHAKWPEIAALPWLMAPSISTHHALASQLFLERRSAPATLIEADNEAVIRSLIASELGVGLVREDLARDGVASGELAVWPDARLETTLQFIYPSEHAEEPEIRALVGIIGDVWREPNAHASAGAPNGRPAGRRVRQS